MAQRQIHYNSQLAARASGQLPAPRIPAAPVDDSAARIFSHLDDFMKQAGPVLGRAYVAQQTGRVDDAVLAAGSRFAEWQAQYQQNSQGALAANAAQDYAQAFESIARETMEEFGGKEHTVFPDLLRRRLAERAMYAARDGLQYQTRQTDLWKKSQWESQLDQFQRFVAANPLDTDAVAMEAAALKGSWMAKNPGLDPGKTSNQIDEMAAAAPIEALIRKGDAGGARAALQRAQALAGQPVRAITQGADPALVDMVRKAGTRHGFDARGIEMLLATMMQESSGRADVVSHAGARGPMQLMPGTARELGVDINDPEQNIDGGVRYLKGLLKKYNGNWEAALSAYNMGPGGYDAYKAGRGKMPQETREYYPRIMRRLQGDPDGAIGGALSPRQLGHFEGAIAQLERQELARAQAEMSQGLANYIASCEDGNLAGLPYSERMIRATFQDKADDILMRASLARQYASDLDQAKRLPAAAQMEMLARARPDPNSASYRLEAARHDRLAAGIARIQKARAEDPGAYALSVSQQAQAARQAFLSDMNPRTASAYLAAMDGAAAGMGMRAAAFSKADAASLSEMITRAKEPAAMLKQFGQCFGGELPRVMRELGGNLSPTFHIIAKGMPDDAARLIIQAERDKDFGKKSYDLLRMRGSDITDFEETVAGRMAGYTDSFLPGGNSQMPLALKKSVTNLAIQYMGRLALDEDDAIDRAMREVVEAHYEIREQGGWASRSARPLRIPKSQDVDAVSAGLDIFRQAADIDGIAVEAMPGMDGQAAREMYQSMIRREGYWVTDGDESGAVLFIGGNAVMGIDGQPFRKSWEELAGMARERDRRVDEAARTQAGAGIAEGAAPHAQASLE